MTPHHTERLDPITWLERIGHLFAGLDDCGASPERHIRKAYHLVRLAPEMVSSVLPQPVDEDTFEAMLADKQYEPLVLTFFRPGSALSASESSATSGDRAVAMLAAWANSFVQPKAQLS